ncbi:MAG: hypothetical protein U0Q22_03940 [Acidimicrobiales bacterium]
MTTEPAASPDPAESSADTSAPGRGTQLANWTIDAMQQSGPTDRREPLDRSHRRVLDAVAALRDARTSIESGDLG